MPLRADLRIRQGATWSVTVPVLAADNTPANLSGYTSKAQVREGYAASGTPLYEWTVAAGNMTIGVGQIVLSVPAATSAAWTWRLARWDLELTAPNGAVTPLVEGSVIVDPEITV